MNDGGFIDMINSFFGGAITTLIGVAPPNMAEHTFMMMMAMSLCNPLPRSQHLRLGDREVREDC